MKHVTLCLPVAEADRTVLLGLKKRGFGQGKIVGLGGKIEDGEGLAQAAARELYEEAGLQVDPEGLLEVARLTFLFPTSPEWDHLLHVFIAREWHGDPVESAEIAARWYRFDAIPFDRTWDDARYWLPRLLAGERFLATCVYAGDRETVVEVKFGEFRDSED